MNLGNDRTELSVSELSRAIKSSLEEQFGRVKVRGEINSLAKPNSGHLYFSLVDPLDNTRIQAACWRRSASRLKMSPKDGQEVIVSARVTAYGARSQYQLIVENIELAGIGALLKMLEERRQKLAKEGLFNAERKRPLPFLPKRIGVITSEKGAVWHDILHRIEDRFSIPIVLCPVLVQGDAAAAQIVAAIAAMNALPTPQRPDVLIVARGGGSMEDLLPFQDEAVVRGVAASAIPIISAIGHETDTTLIDYAADLRAPTPTAAAELVVPVRRDLLRQVQNVAVQLNRQLEARLENQQLRLARLGQYFSRPEHLLESPQQSLDIACLRLKRGTQQRLHDARQALQQSALRLVSPREILQRQRIELAHQHQRLHYAKTTVIEIHQRELCHLGTRLIPSQGRWKQASESLQQQQILLSRAMERKCADKREKLRSFARLLDNTSVTRTLERGFALVTDENDALITTAHAAQYAKRLTMRFSDGQYTPPPSE
ncbi:MAG: exodeoxyribonuclease VII large subunit [Alphaproteobacteria bacterium]|nr:exodeoxyribonuclease VII large subunit [Alphaproteobacteria bacterium]